jgi:hypothetical protein
MTRKNTITPEGTDFVLTSNVPYCETNFAVLDFLDVEAYANQRISLFERYLSLEYCPLRSVSCLSRRMRCQVPVSPNLILYLIKLVLETDEDTILWSFQLHRGQPLQYAFLNDINRCCSYWIPFVPKPNSPSSLVSLFPIFDCCESLRGLRPLIYSGWRVDTSRDSAD